MLSTLRMPVLLLLVSPAASGCSGLAGNRSAFSPQLRTIASIGDKPLPVVAGVPGESVAVDTVDPPRRTREEGRVSGRVTDARGNPVPNARVRVAIGGASGGRAIRTTTDDSGGFTLHGLRPGSDYTVIAEADEAQGLITGRSSVQAPDSQVRIRLRDLEDAQAAAGSARVSPVSNLRDGDDPGEPDAAEEAEAEDRPRRVNEEDLPPAPEAEALAPAGPATRQGERRPLPQLAAPVQGSGWRRGAPTSDPGAPTDPKANKSSTEAKAEEPGAPVAAIDPIDPPRRDVRVPDGRADVDPIDPPGRDDPPTRKNPTQVPIEDDIPNPLPPALPSRQVPAAADRRRGEPSDRVAPEPAAAGPMTTETVGEEPVPNAGAGESAPEDGPGLATPDTASDPTSHAEVPEMPQPVQEAAPEPQASRAPGPRESESSRDSSIRPVDPSPRPVEGLAASSAGLPTGPVPEPNKRPRWGEVAAQYTETDAAELASTGPMSTDSTTVVAAASPPSPPPSEPSGLIRTRLGSKGKAADVSKPFCRYDPKRRQLIDFRLHDLQGQPVRFQDLDADYVLLDFWGTWCSYCVKSIPHLVELQKQLGPQKLKVVGIAYEEGPRAHQAAQVAEMAQRLGINYTLLLGGVDGPCPLQAQLHVQAYPTLILVDRYGRVLWRDQGATPTTLARLDRVLASATSGEFVRR